MTAGKGDVCCTGSGPVTGAGSVTNTGSVTDAGSAADSVSVMSTGRGSAAS